MTQVETVSVETAEAAQAFIQSHGSGPVMVLSPETLEHIQQAEDAGGFEGGQSGGVDGGYSAEGDGGPEMNLATDPPPVDYLDMDGAITGAWFENQAERALTLRDIIEALKGEPLGLMILVPTKELQRLIGLTPPDEA
ncbi:hypothetical protein ACLMAL_23775 [Nocardia sp. CWNU-33]|uniref:hypothetical protein n=1 Tax=Nocardia sp. CWNU-33 TaxID=3392117 RepID=UPI00398EB46B